MPAHQVGHGDHVKVLSELWRSHGDHLEEANVGDQLQEGHRLTGKLNNIIEIQPESKFGCPRTLPQCL